MSKLTTEKRAMILRCLCEGTSIRSTCRITGAAKNTVLKLLAEIGPICWGHGHHLLRNLPCERIQADEAWGFSIAKDKNLTDATIARGGGSFWIWTAICEDTRLAISWFIGNRGSLSAKAFLGDLASRLAADRIALTTDGLMEYVRGARIAFKGKDLDQAVLQKLYGSGSNSARGGRYSPAPLVGIRKKIIMGDPDLDRACTSYAERFNLHLRTANRRMTRLTIGHSKKLENLHHSMALTYWHHNFAKPHRSLEGRQTPAQAAGATDRLWTVENMIECLDVSKRRRWVA